MTKTVNTRKEVQMPAGIRKKLTAAICMLLISCIMLVSSTYAWFTLSTAPEVTGITTNVGANGNLEMMLLSAANYASSEDNLGVESQVGDSSAIKEVVEANKTWGNLVDLTSSTYGLGQIILTPARLNLTGSTVASSILLAPSYGSDGRVIEIGTPTYNATLDSASNTFIYNAGAAGVRAIGTTSGVTIRLSAYRSAISTASSNTTNALTAARNSLDSNAQALGSMIVAMAQGTATDYSNYLPTLQSIINGAKESNDYAAVAIKNTVLAYNLSSANATELEDDDVTSIVGAVNDTDLSVGFGSYTNKAGSTVALMTPSGTTEALTSYNKVATAVSGAQTAYDAIVTTDGVSENEIRTVLDYLVVTSKVQVGDYDGYDDAGNVKMYQATSANMNSIINAITGNDFDVDILLGDESGVYDDLADMCGYFSVSTTVDVDATSYSAALGVITADANMFTTPGVTGSINTALSASQGKAPSESAGGTITLGDTYGYALDLGFRTNAASSNLLLQTAAMQRVYIDGDAANTQGAGSYMEFATLDVKTFSVEEVKALMSAIRIAFVTPKTFDATDNSVIDYELLAMGALEVQPTLDAQGKVTGYEGGAASGTTGWKAGVYLYDYTPNDDGTITLGDQMADKSSITDLTQNKGKKVTVVVYLDGDIVDNTMVANANQSMTGEMNLQFSSSASLKPMENSGMRDGGTPSSESEEVTYESVATAGASFTYNGVTGTVNDGYTVYKGTDGNYYYSKDATTYVVITIKNYGDVITTTSTN